MGEFLVFVKLIGMTIEGEYIYQFLFSTEPESVWGEGFNIMPSSIIPDLEPDMNTVSSKAKVMSPEPMITACESSCFSMQDCIDGITAVAFMPADSDRDLVLRFGETIQETRRKLTEAGLELSDIEDVAYDSDNDVDAIVDSLKGDDGNEDDDGEEDDTPF